MSDKAEQFKTAWNELGKQLFDNEKLVENLETGRLVEAVGKLAIALPYGKIGVGVLITDKPSYETFNAALSLSTMGVAVKVSRLLNDCNNREWLVNEHIKAGYERLLLLDGDCVIDARGFHRMMDTMDRTAAAMVCALTPVRNGQGLAAWEDHDEDSNNLVQVKRESIPRSGVAFNVAHCSMAVSLLDLTKIKAIRSPRFRAKSEGEATWTTDELFCRTLKENNLDFVVDPQVTTIMMGAMGYSFKWMPPAE
jgi:hypothetical protein